MPPSLIYDPSLVKNDTSAEEADSLYHKPSTNSSARMQEEEARELCDYCRKPLEGQTAAVEGKQYHIDCFRVSSER